MKVSGKRLLTIDQQIDVVAQKLSVEHGVAVEVTHVNPGYCIIKMTDSVHNKSLTEEINVDASLREKILGVLESLYNQLIEER